MKIEVLPIEDLQAFRAQLLNDIKELLSKKINERNLKPLIKSNEVRKLLSISPGTLHNLRITGKIKSKKIGNLHYYKQEEIEKLMDREE